jgi:hypothetical protein
MLAAVAVFRKVRSNDAGKHSDRGLAGEIRDVSGCASQR